MARFKLTIEFDGTHFSGWQIQPDARTVEQTLEDAFSQVLQQDVDLIGQGRTDSGVHARGQTAHVDLPDDADYEKLVYAVNGIIGDEIYINAIEKVEDDFHARFDALSREYVYTISRIPNPLERNYLWVIKSNPDLEVMNECAAMLSGEFDFAGFSKFNPDNYTTLCEIHLSEFEDFGNKIQYRIRANRFLRNMVRRLVGTMVKVGEGKLSASDFRFLLENPKAEIQTYTAPSKGLILEKVLY